MKDPSLSDSKIGDANIDGDDIHEDGHFEEFNERQDEDDDEYQDTYSTEENMSSGKLDSEEHQRYFVNGCFDRPSRHAAVQALRSYGLPSSTWGRGRGRGRGWGSEYLNSQNFNHQDADGYAESAESDNESDLEDFEKQQISAQLKHIDHRNYSQLRQEGVKSHDWKNYHKDTREKLFALMRVLDDCDSTASEEQVSWLPFP
jgi:hypothetical protein